MSRRELASMAAAMLAASALLAGCAGAKDKSAPEGSPAAAQDSAAPAKGASSMAGMAGMAGMSKIVIPADADYTEADVQFMQGMIHHHAQAITMSAMAPTHGAGRLVALLCKKINISQSDEIRLMQTWLKVRNQAVPDPNDAHPMVMPGMLTADQMKQLDAARGTEFDKLFLTYMIQHHRGALTMVTDLFDHGGGQPSEMFQYASDVNADQTGEIGRMQDMLTSLPGSNSQ